MIDYTKYHIWKDPSDTLSIALSDGGNATLVDDSDEPFVVLVHHVEPAYADVVLEDDISAEQISMLQIFICFVDFFLQSILHLEMGLEPGLHLFEAGFILTGSAFLIYVVREID